MPDLDHIHSLYNHENHLIDFFKNPNASIEAVKYIDRNIDKDTADIEYISQIIVASSEHLKISEKSLISFAEYTNEAYKKDCEVFIKALRLLAGDSAEKVKLIYDKLILDKTFCKVQSSLLFIFPSFKLDLYKTYLKCVKKCFIADAKLGHVAGVITDSVISSPPCCDHNITRYCDEALELFNDVKWLSSINDIYILDIIRGLLQLSTLMLSEHLTQRILSFHAK